MSNYPDNLRGGPGSPYPGIGRVPNSAAAKDRATLLRIADLLDASAGLVEDAQKDLHTVSQSLSVRHVPAELRAAAEEIRKDDVATVMGME